MNERNIKKVSISLLILLILIGLALGGVKIQDQREKDAHEENITKGAQLINESNRTLIGTQIQDDLNEMDILKQEDIYLVQDKSSNQWQTIAKQGIVTGPATSDLIPPITMVEFSSQEQKTPEVLLKNGDCVVFTAEDGAGWHCRAGQVLSFHFERYPSDYVPSQIVTIGYICDGILYEGTSFSEISGTYQVCAPTDGDYDIYIISGASDYLGLKEGRISLE